MGGIQEFHGKFVLAPADGAAGGVVVVWEGCCVDTLRQELGTAKTYEHNRLNETSIVDGHRCHMAVKFGLFVDEDHGKLLRYTGYLNFINGPMGRVLLLILARVQLLGCVFFWLLASLQLKAVSFNIAQQFMKEMVKICFGLLKIQVKFLINQSLEVF